MRSWGRLAGTIQPVSGESLAIEWTSSFSGVPKPGHLGDSEMLDPKPGTNMPHYVKALSSWCWGHLLPHWLHRIDLDPDRVDCDRPCRRFLRVDPGIAWFRFSVPSKWSKLGLHGFSL